MISAYRTDAIREAEEPLLAAGVPLMQQAANALAVETARELKARGRHRVSGARVLGLVGAGNNGGDALFALARLRARGAGCAALVAVPGSAHAEGLEAARKAGVRILEAPDSLAELAEAVRSETLRADAVIDGLLGIGARGCLREPLATIVAAANGAAGEAEKSGACRPVMIAADAPSGIGTDDGTVPRAENGAAVAFRADVTVTMGAAKVGLVLDPSRRYAGEVRIADLGFGFPDEPALVQLEAADVRSLWRIPGPGSHKYARGVVGLMTGSLAYPGAGILSTGAALAAGAGMVRFAGPRHLAEMMLMQHPEIVTVPGRVQAWVLGSGVDMSDDVAAAEVARRLQESLAEGRPVVLDAGAIALAANAEMRSSVVLTPHAGEIAELLCALGETTTREDVAANPARAARLASTLTGATVLLKGPVDIACAPDGPLYAVPGAPGWRATAGAGDVMAGLLGAVLAMWGDELVDLRDGHGIPARLAAAAAFLHARAAGMAAGVEADASGRTWSGRPIRASEIAAAVPEAIARTLEA